MRVRPRTAAGPLALFLAGVTAVTVVGAPLPGTTTAAETVAPTVAPRATTLLARPLLKPLATMWVGLPSRVLVSVGVPRRTVVVQERTGSTWRSLARATTVWGGTATLSWTPTRAGRTVLRAVLVAAPASPARVGLPLAVTVARPAGATVPPSVPSARVARVVAAGGQRMWIDCAGRGGPTTVLVSGLWGTHADWDAQIAGWRARGRVCVYDRPGVGFSPSRTGSKTVDAGRHALELRALLRAAGERGPFLLVGHSYGGLVVRAMLRQVPSLVAGVELLDAIPPGIEHLYTGYGRTRDEGGAVIDIDLSSAATGYQAPLPGLPLAVVSAGHPITWAPSWVAGVWTREQDRAARGSANSLRIVAVDGLHQLQVYAPAITARSVQALRDAVRRHVPLPPCPGTWAAVRGLCIPR